MTEFQLLYMRFLQAKRDFPSLRHDGHGPTPTIQSINYIRGQYPPNPQNVAWTQLLDALREFERSDWQ